MACKIYNNGSGNAIAETIISGESLSKHLQPISHFADSPKRDQPIDDLQTNDTACKYYDG